MSDPDKVIFDDLVPEEAELTQKQMMRGIMLQAGAAAKAKAKAAEKVLKGFYCDFVFDRLNLTKYR